MRQAASQAALVDAGETGCLPSDVRSCTMDGLTRTRDDVPSDAPEAGEFLGDRALFSGVFFCAFSSRVSSLLWSRGLCMFRCSLRTGDATGGVNAHAGPCVVV